MAYFEWADDMVIDNGAIDEDHRHLIGLVNELHTATSHGKGSEVIQNILSSLISYTESHLKREETLMELLNFKNLENHKSGHAKFIRKLHELEEKHRGGSITVASQLSTVLRDWLSIHIRRSDKELNSTIKLSKKAGAFTG